MANTRKVLINRHSTKPQAPLASEMYLGEIAISHPSDLSATTIFTKNGDMMIPFASCAMTKIMIDNAISDADVSYEVKKAEGEAFINVGKSVNGSAVTFTVSSEDIQGKAAFDAYSAATDTTIKENYNTLSGAIDDVLAIITTAITGDNIISVTPTTSGAGSYALAHKTATAVTGFNKLETDAYGHVTAATAVAASDIKNLGFEDSAWTEEKIASAITSLDSSISASSEGKYFTALAIENGKLVAKEEADIPVLSVESAGTGNVVASITVADHKITYQTASVATSEGIAELSAATVALSAGTVHDLVELSGATQAISGYAHDEIAALSAGTIQLSADTKAAIDALSAGTLHDIEVLSGAVKANETNINTVSGDVIELSAATVAIKTDLGNLSAVTLTGVSLNNTPLAVNNHIVSVPVTTSGSGIAGAAAADSGSMASAIAVKEYVEDTLSSAVEYKGATGATPSNPAKGDLYIASSDFVVEGSKSAETGDFIIYDGEKWDVIEKNLDGAITGNLTQDTVTLGDSTNSVKSLTNGTAGQVLTIGTAGTPVWADDPVLSTATTGNGNVVSEITVNDHEITYVKNFTAATNADLEIVSGIVDTFSAATVAEFNSAFTAINTLSADAHNSMIARDDAVFSSAVTYVDDQIDEVYASAVSYADSAITVAIEALDSETAVTEGNYITGIAIKDGKISGITQTALPANVVLTATTATPVDTASAVLTGVTASGTDNHALTFGMSNKVFSASTADEAVKVKSALTINILTSAGTTASTSTFDGHENVTVDIPGSHDTATTETGHYAPSTTASSLDAAAGTVLNKVTLDSKNHVISAGTTDKINSASTADSADKVANKLTMTDETNSQDYDGSAAKSLTFGTATTSTGVNGRSMSMTSAGVVDVDIIDCGEY